MPPDASMLCRYGLPFRAGTSPVSRYFAGVGSEAGLTDIVAYEEVRYFMTVDTFGNYSNNYHHQTLIGDE